MILKTIFPFAIALNLRLGDPEAKHAKSLLNSEYGETLRASFPCNWPDLKVRTESHARWPKQECMEILQLRALD